MALTCCSRCASLLLLASLADATCEAGAGGSWSPEVGRSNCGAAVARVGLSDWAMLQTQTTQGTATSLSFVGAGDVASIGLVGPQGRRELPNIVDRLDEEEEAVVDAHEGTTSKETEGGRSVKRVGNVAKDNTPTHLDGAAGEEDAMQERPARKSNDFDGYVASSDSSESINEQLAGEHSSAHQANSSATSESFAHNVVNGKDPRGKAHSNAFKDGTSKASDLGVPSAEAASPVADARLTDTSREGDPYKAAKEVTSSGQHGMLTDAEGGADEEAPWSVQSFKDSNLFEEHAPLAEVATKASNTGNTEMDKAGGSGNDFDHEIVVDVILGHSGDVFGKDNRADMIESRDDAAKPLHSVSEFMPVHVPAANAAANEAAASVTARQSNDEHGGEQTFYGTPSDGNWNIGANYGDVAMEEDSANIEGTTRQDEAVLEEEMREADFDSDEEDALTEEKLVRSGAHVGQ